MSEVFPWKNKGCNVTCAFPVKSVTSPGWIINIGHSNNPTPEKAASQAGGEHDSLFSSF